LNEQVPPTTDENIADNAPSDASVFCPSCAARVTERAEVGEMLRCLVCGTEFQASGTTDAAEEGTENAIVRSDTPPNQPAKRLSTEQILLDRLTKEPPVKKQVLWTTIALVLGIILVASFAIFKQMQKPDRYAPGEPVDPTVLAQKRMYFQHIIDSLQQVLAVNPQNADLHLLLADAYYNEDEWAKSRNEFVAYLGVHPEDPDARVYYAYAIAQDGDPIVAISELDTALRYKPDYLNALVNAGILTTETINDSNHTETLARARNYFERAKAIAVKTDPKAAAKIDTLLAEINKTGERMAGRSSP